MPWLMLHFINLFIDTNHFVKQGIDLRDLVIYGYCIGIT